MLWGSSGLPLAALGSLHDSALPSSPWGITWAWVRSRGQRHRYGARPELPRALAGVCVLPRGRSRAWDPTQGTGDSQGLPFHPPSPGRKGLFPGGSSSARSQQGPSPPPGSPRYTLALEFSGFSLQRQPWASCISSSLTTWG